MLCSIHVLCSTQQLYLICSSGKTGANIAAIILTKSPLALHHLTTVQTLYKEHISSALQTDFCYYKHQLHAQQTIIISYKSVNYFFAIISIITINLQCQTYTDTANDQNLCHQWSKPQNPALLQAHIDMSGIYVCLAPAGILMSVGGLWTRTQAHSMWWCVHRLKMSYEATEQPPCGSHANCPKKIPRALKHFISWGGPQTGSWQV